MLLEHTQGGGNITYVIGLFKIPVIYYIITVIISIIVYVWKKQLNLCLLIGYCFLVFSITVLTRKPTYAVRYQTTLFWSWGEWDRLGKQIIANIIAFIPFGILAGRLWRWKGFLFAVLFSIFIEISQLISHRGLFEYDDIVHNSVGALIGIGLLTIMKLCMKNTQNRRKCSR